MTTGAVKVIRRAEEELRAQAQRALAEGRYVEVAAIARMADGLAQLAALNGADPASNPPGLTDSVRDAVPGTREPIQPAIPPGKTARGNRKAFPRFEREEDKLVKIAWSKKDRAEYEHKAPRQVVNLLIDSIKGRKGLGARFIADDIFPMKDQKTKKEVPSYQAYLALLWLVHEGVITKYGREGYALKPTAATPEHVSELWEALPSRN